MLSYILSVVLTTIMSVGFSFMMISTYELDVSIIPFILCILIGAVFCSYVHGLKKKRYSIILFAAIPIILFFCYYLDVMDLEESVDYLLGTLKNYSFRMITAVFRRTNTGRSSQTSLFVFLNMLPVAVSTWVIMKRKHAIFTLLVYAPFMGCAVALNYMFPGQIWCLLAVTGVVIMCFYQNMSKADPAETDKRLLVFIIPTLLLTIALGMIYPQASYSKQKTASKTVETIRSLFVHVKKATPDPVSEGAGKIFEEVQRTYMGSVISENIAHQMISFSGQKEDLSLVGNFNPPKFTVLTVMRTPIGVGQGINTDKNYLYLKTSSKDTYSGDAWDISENEPNEIFDDDLRPVPHEADYELLINSTVEGGFSFVPYYTDFYAVSSPTTRFQDADGEMKVDANARMMTEKTGNKSVYAYPVASLPHQYREDFWTDEYLDYVYSENLQVPEETRQAILDTGMLPDWYMQVYNGEIEMSDYDKVRMVTAYVSQIHPYDAYTDFPKNDMDFVVWFMTESSTGFCVHYATTAVILLRMIGVPARYVTGYMTNGVYNGAPKDVLSTDAHAWFEFFSEEYGWVMGDPTPGNERAASGFNIDAVLLYYVGEIDPVATTTPDPNKPTSTPRPTRTPTRTPTPTPKAEEKIEMPHTIARVINSLVIMLAVFLILMIIRLSYTMHWKRAFKKGSVNDRARAYYRYFNMMLHVYHARPGRRMSTIAQQAAFSADGISEKDLNALIDLGNKTLEKVSVRQNKAHRKLVDLSLKVNT